MQKIASFEPTFSKKLQLLKGVHPPSDTPLRHATPRPALTSHSRLQKVCPPLRKSFRRLCPCPIEVGLLSIGQVTQFNHLNYEITPSNLFSVPSTIDGLLQLQIYEVMRLTHAWQFSRFIKGAVALASYTEDDKITINTVGFTCKDI